MSYIKYLIAILSILLLMAKPSFSAELAGHIILTKGNVIAENSALDNRILKRRSKVFSGDVIKTGPAGSVQIRFIDKALMTIKSSSELNIERYLSAQQQGTGKKEQVLMTLVKGGFRTITGSIGKGDKGDYKVNTPAASIGIRGTNYEVQQEADGAFVMGVYSGGIEVNNEAGTIELGDGADFNFTRVKPKSSPKGLLAPPPTLAENNATEQSSDDESEGDQTASDDTSSDDNEETTNEDSGDETSTDSQTASDSSSSNNDLSDATGAIANIDSGISSAIDDKLADTIEQTVDKVAEQLVPDPFDFNNPYKGIDASNVDNPFDQTTITDEQFALANTGRLSLLAMPISELSTKEAQLISPGIITASGHDFITENGRVRLSYEVYNKDTNNTDFYEIEFIIDAATSGSGDLVSFLTPTAITDYRKNGIEQTGIPIDEVSVNFNSADNKYEFTAAASNADSFILRMELNIEGDTEGAALALQQELGSDTTTTSDNWESSTDFEIGIANGSWDKENNRPILVTQETDFDLDTDGNLTPTEDRIAVIRKPSSNETVNNIVDFANCANNSQTCDIQVDKVAASEQIRWGLWLTEPGNGVEISGFNSEDNTIEVEQEDDILAFWIAAERADINQLQGTASFTANSDCSDFSQCVGLADDGIVQSLTAQFDVNFSNGAVTNGNLTLQTTGDDPSSIAQGTPGTVASTWNVNFSGNMSANLEAGRAEFQTHNLEGSVEHNATTSTDIIGNIGGIFVKPGDKFAGGYNLGTTDGSEKRTSGVFSMDKQ